MLTKQRDFIGCLFFKILSFNLFLICMLCINNVLAAWND